MRGMNRRTFLESSLATGILASLPARAFAAMHQIDKVGVQLYTVRDLMKKDLSGTIAKVATIGYKEVEFAGYFNHSPADIRAILDKNGLAAPSCHVGYDVVEKHWPETIEAAQTIGHSFIVCPGIDEKARKTADGWKGVAELFNHAGEASKKAGIQFGYHNHTFEFQPDPILGGKRAYDFLLESTDPSLVKMEMDLCWISTTGTDPVGYFHRFAGRFPLVHVKDFKTFPKPPAGKKVFEPNTEFEKNDMTEPGSGIIDWKSIFSHADEAGIQHFFFEHDQPADPFASLAASYKYLSTLRF
jgi:sugar phosphate isomerase/epimerase